MLNAEEWRARSKAMGFDARAVVGGRRVASRAEETIESACPADGRVLYSLPVGSAEDADEAVKSSRSVFDRGDWSDLSPLMRKGILMAFAGAIDAHQEELAL